MFTEGIDLAGCGKFHSKNGNYDLVELDIKIQSHLTSSLLAQRVNFSYSRLKLLAAGPLGVDHVLRSNLPTVYALDLRELLDQAGFVPPSRLPIAVDSPIFAGSEKVEN